MGTRSITKIYNYDGVMLAAMYRQYDGYYTGHGQELADFLASKTLVNGIRPGVDKRTIANGPGCLAAQIIAHFKTEPGAIYLYPLTDDCEEFNYEVRCDGDLGFDTPKSIRLVAEGYYGPAFDGDPAGFDGDYLEEVDCEDFNTSLESVRKRALAKLDGVLTAEERDALGLS